jgi:hypothetical protein
MSTGCCPNKNSFESAEGGLKRFLPMDIGVAKDRFAPGGVDPPESFDIAWSKP